MTHASLFSGIGGPEVAAAMLGWDNVFHCEINPFGRQVLEYWFPNSDSYEDITKTDFTKYRGQIDVLTGGFPCQPFSYAGKRGGRQMTAISGQRCSALLTKSGPLGLLVKMLLESPLWWSPAGLLTWEVRPLFSRRIVEFTDSDLNTPSPLNESAETLSQRDIPSSRCLFRLALSELHTGDTESSLLLITPTAVMTCESPENMRARVERNGYQNGTKYGSLESQIMYDQRFSGLLKTPCAMDAGADRRKSKGVSGTSGTLAQEIASGYVEKRGLILPTPRSCSSMGASLDTEGMRSEKRFPNLEVVIAKLLPTPTAGEGVKWTNTYNPNSQMGQSLSAMAGSGMLPTPSARDWKGRTNPGVVKEGSGCIYGEALPDAVERMEKDCGQKKDGVTSRLSPLFTEEMMGFPLMWTTLPFLSLNGETSH